MIVGSLALLSEQKGPHKTIEVLEYKFSPTHRHGFEHVGDHVWGVSSVPAKPPLDPAEPPEFRGFANSFMDWCDD